MDGLAVKDRSTQGDLRFSGLPPWPVQVHRSGATGSMHIRLRPAESEHRSRRTAARHFPLCVQHWLDLRWRAGYDAQDFTRRRLLLQ